MRLALVTVVLGLGTACITQGQFDNRFAKTACEANNECLSLADLPTVTCDDFEPSEDSTVECDFDGAAARSCLHDLRRANCQGPLVLIPQSCAEVYTGCTAF